MAMMAQIVDLLARQDERLRALEDKQLGDWARQGINPQRTTTAEDPVLSKLNLPASFDVQFYEGSTRLTLAAQLQLNEVLEYMGMHPSLRVVCTGHADVTGDRTANLNLSKQRVLSPAELLGLPPDEQIILISGLGFIRCKKVWQNQIAPMCHDLGENPVEGAKLPPDPRVTFAVPGVNT